MDFYTQLLHYYTIITKNYLYYVYIMHIMHAIIAHIFNLSYWQVVFFCWYKGDKKLYFSFALNFSWCTLNECSMFPQYHTEKYGTHCFPLCSQKLISIFLAEWLTLMFGTVPR